MKILLSYYKKRQRFPILKFQPRLVIVNKDQIKTISESSGHYACVSLLDGSKLYSLYTVKDFAKLLGLKKEDET